MVTTPITPIRIEVGGPGSTTFKSIDHVIWEDVPGLAVLTGVNGSGKTQLLEVLAYRLTGAYFAYPDFEKIKVVITGDAYSPDVVTYIPSQWQFGGTHSMGVGQMQSVKQQLFQQYASINANEDLRTRVMRTRLERLFGGRSLAQVGPENFSSALPDDFGFMLDEANVTQGLVYVFVAYRLRVVEAIEAGTSKDKILDALGPAPWDLLNETFQAADFPYRAVSPVGTKLLDPYQTLLEMPATKQRIRVEDLSSGEQVLLALVLWLYNSQHHGRFPRLLLLDEPDAHLHPSMTRHFLNVIKDVLVDRYGVRTILTTHSPSTVALAPAGSVFEMSKTKPRIKPSVSQAASIGLLTAGLVTVSPSTRYVLAEDEADVTFYETIRDLLTDYGPSRDPMAIAPAPSIVFLPASTGAGKGKSSGGRSVVEGWVDKFDCAPLDEFIRGVIDRDTANVGTSRVYPVGRYSIENYLLDPFVVFGLLLGAGKAPTVPDVVISSGDEHRLRGMSVKELRAILTVIRAVIEPVASKVFTAPIDLTPCMVTFTNGITIDYPAWMIDYRGHDLLPIYQATFGSASLINPSRLVGTIRRTRLIPQELARLMMRLQA